jgi:hypothetical protein
MIPLPTFYETDAIASAIQFINSTQSHIFLTGKAGTGKTTFLKNLAQRTHKSFVVVAPTGIAALNAGGVTIHSQFLFPLGMFVPDRYATVFEGGALYTSSTLAKKHPLNSARKQVLRSIDLLVIDEVSMLRADLLDAIDYRLKAAKGNFRQSFGGVQLLLIGDLFQLPPVVKQTDEQVLKKYYPSPWFFESKALKESDCVYIELDKIFRQKDDKFIDLLNNLRDNKATVEDIATLNAYYKPPDEIAAITETITLTTHNYRADDLNQKALRELKATSHFLDATIEGEFPESMYPVLSRIEIKVGAQIMFTKNDSEGKAYFNGKLATVTSIREEEIEVTMAESHQQYVLKKEVWENKKYSVNTLTQELDDEIIGTFEQYPIRLAWAITVHKSQGLTFDKAIIDVGQAFADGQVYVALSRLRSLDGLVLRTRIDPHVISTDTQVVIFSKENNRPNELLNKMKIKQIEFVQEIINKTFEFDLLLKEVVYISKDHTNFGEGEANKPVLKQVSNMLHLEVQNTIKFRAQLSELLLTKQFSTLTDRLAKGREYYTNKLRDVSKILLEEIELMRYQKKVKSYLNDLVEVDQLLAKKTEQVDKANYLTHAILQGKEQFDFSEINKEREKRRYMLLEEVRSKVNTELKSEKKRLSIKKSASNKKSEPSTYDVTLSMLENGMSVSEIAKERGLAVGTIEGHLGRAVAEKRISIFKFVSEEDVNIITTTLKEMPDNFTSKELFDKLKGKYGYGILRAVMIHSDIKSTRKIE